MAKGSSYRSAKIRTSISVNGTVPTADMLKAMGERARFTAPLMERMVEELATISRLRVQSAPYIPLTDSTIARKESQGEDTGIFKDEWRPIGGTPTRVGNKLYTALTSDGAPGQMRRVTRTSATFGVNSSGNGELFYARFVQNVKGKKRKILALTAGDALAITERIGNWIMDSDKSTYRSLR